MPRGMRVKSRTGIYHIMCRGNNKQDIFIGDGDMNKYYYLLSDAKKKYDFDLYAFCFMSNHIHMVVREKTDSISEIMRCINSGYGVFINRKHERVGHVFQGRFRSEPIEADSYLLSAVRYVHNNPVKACMVDSPEKHYWNSYRGYIDGKEFAEILDAEYVLKYFGEGRRTESLGGFIRFSRKDDDILLCDIEEDLDREKKVYKNMVGSNPSEETIEKAVRYMISLGYTKSKVKEVTGRTDYAVRKMYNIIKNHPQMTGEKTFDSDRLINT